MVEATWTGAAPNLCSGRWVLKIDGKDVSRKIPLVKRHKPMGTRGYYNSYGLDENWQTTLDNYMDGLERDEWIEENAGWLSSISEGLEVQQEIYNAFNLNDWRYGECGGCI